MKLTSSNHMIYKFKLLGTLLLFLLSITCTCWAAPLTLILDELDKDKLPRAFRTSQDRHLFSQISGFNDLKVAGGAQFSQLQLSNILKQLKTSKLIVIDLREESHGFINGTAVSWFGMSDAPNLGKSPVEIEQDQKERLTGLLKYKIVNVYDVLEKKHEIIRKYKIYQFRLKDSKSEEQIVNEMGSHYYRIYVTDHHMPSNLEIDRFVNIVKNIPKQSWIYFHCEAGRGRTSTFMVMFDMLHHAKRDSMEEIFKRQADIGGKDFRELQDAKHLPKDKLDRLNLFRQFYRYAKENHDGFKTTYTQWAKTHP